MREIKFRGKDIYSDKWVEGVPLVTSISGVYMVSSKGQAKNSRNGMVIKDVVVQREVDHQTVGQYTGKDDCNGKPMFEGDIVKTNLGHIQTIEWSNDYCAFVCIEKGYDKPCQVDILDEIIGNIHDNPELINGN